MKKLLFVSLIALSACTACSKDVKQEEEKPAFPCEAVDLGLSVKWAAWNLAEEKPEGYDEYLQWANTTMFTHGSSHAHIDWDNCPYHSGLACNKGWSKYNTIQSYGTVDNKTVLEQDDDAAHILLHGKWRIPTYAEWVELKDNCDWKWTTLNGMNGYKVTGKNGNSIFLPAAGYYAGESRHQLGSEGHYWSSTLNENGPCNALHMSFTSSERKMWDRNRCDALSIRPVTE